MSLRSKILLILCGVVAVNVLADNAVQRFMVETSFVSLERVEAEKDLERAVEMIRDEVHDLDDKSRRWASWRPTYDFVYEEDPGYVRDNLGPAALANAGLDLLYVCDDARRVVFGRVEHGPERAPAALRDFGAEVLPPYPLFRVIEQRLARGEEVVASDVTSGLLLTELGPLLVSTSPILKGDGRGPFRGSVIVGRFLDGELAEDIGRRVNVELAYWSLEGDEGLPVEQDFLDRVTAEAPAPVSDPVSGEKLHVYTTFADMRRIPALLVRAEVDREILARGRSSVRYALLSTMGTALLILFVLYRLLAGIVLRPLSRLTAHAVAIGQTDDTSAKVGMDGRDDEFGTLSREFDRMLEKLAASRAAHAETARMVGMSEIATGVLHNVGNVLNSVNVSRNLVARRAEQLRVGDLEKMTAILRQNADDLARFVTEDPRGQHLLSFLSELTNAMSEQRRGILEELAGLGEGVEHIIELVRSQQSYAGKTSLYEPADLAEQLEQALKISSQALRGREDVEVTRDYEELPPIPLDKRKVTEVFVNIIQNARHAMRDVEGGKRLSFKIRRTDGGCARVEIRDTGVGISAENLARIFNHGFTTKSDGHGFGLHTSANAATEMKGRLWAESEGPGKGATFILELPMEVQPTAAAA